MSDIRPYLLFPCGLAAVVLAWASGFDPAAPAATIAACAAIAIFGLPHGTFDLQLIRRERDAGRGMTRLAMLYIACAGAMFMLWRVDARLALPAFLIIAVVHFAEDWEDTGSGFLAAGLATAVLSVPALFHRAALTAIFTSMTGADGAPFADALLLVAPVSLAIAAVGIAPLAAAGRRDLAFGAAGAIAAMTVLPPAVGFALFFCLLHSPRHFAAALERLSWRGMTQWSPVVIPLTLAAGMAGAAIFLLQPAGSLPGNAVAATFILLSVLTVPHMVVPILVKLRDASSERAAKSYA